MTEHNIWLRKNQKWASFWTNLKQGYDLFEQSKIPPMVSVCKGRYIFAMGSSATAFSAVEGRCSPGKAIQ